MVKNETQFKNIGKCDIDNRIRCNLSRLRRLKNLSQRQLGHLSGIQYIGQIESGHASVGKDVVSRMAKALQVDVSEFYRPEEGPDTITEITRACSILSKEAQAHILDVVKSMVVYETRISWRE